MDKAKYLTLFCMLFFACLPLLAQPGDPGSGNTVPIDGGASILAAAGVAYGAKKLYDFRKQKEQEDTD